MAKHDPIAEPLRRLLTAGILALLAFAGYLVLEPFLVPLLWAAILVYASWPLYQSINRWSYGRRTVSALIATLLLMAAVVLPVLAVAGLLADEAGLVYRTLSARMADQPLALPNAVAHIPVVGPWLEETLVTIAGDPALLRTEIGRWLQQSSGALASLAGGLGRNLLGLALTLVISFFFYRDGDLLINQIRRLLWRLLGERAENYIAAVGATVTAVMYGLLLTAIAQGALAGLGYWFVDLQAPILLGAVTALFALVPFGTPLVWGALGVWLLVNNEIWGGIALLLWGTLVVSSIDNLIRPLVISSATHVHFLLVLLGVLGGALAFGFVGLIVGPVVLAVAAAVWNEWLAQTPTEST